MPLRMDEGWNQIQFNLADFTRRAYGTNYVETLRVQVHANCRLRRIYFSDRLYSEEELPPEFKLYLPMQQVLALVFLVKFFGFSISSISVCSYANNCRGHDGMQERRFKLLQRTRWNLCFSWVSESTNSIRPCSYAHGADNLVQKTLDLWRFCMHCDLMKSEHNVCVLDLYQFS